MSGQAPDWRHGPAGETARKLPYEDDSLVDRRASKVAAGSDPEQKSA